jgi:hypothetical protein
MAPFTHTCVDNNHAGCAACEAGEKIKARHHKEKRKRAS